MKKLTLPLGLLLTSGCAVLASPELGRALNQAGYSEAAQLADQAGAAARESAQCERLGQAQVGYDEELVLGGAVAVKWVQNGGGLHLSYPDQPVSALRDAKTVKLPSTPELALNRYLATVGKNLGAQSARPVLEWKFGVLNSPGVNAFSAPGGYVMVTRGLLKSVSNEDQLAGVLAHEIGHVVSRHALRQYQTTKVSQCQVSVGGKALASMATTVALNQDQVRSSFREMLAGGVNLNDAANLDLLGLLAEKTVESLVDHGFSKDAELEADAVATELLMSAGYSVAEYARFVGELPDNGGTFAHHPSGAERKRAILQHAQKVQATDLFAGPGGTHAPVALAASVGG